MDKLTKQQITSDYLRFLDQEKVNNLTDLRVKHVDRSFTGTIAQPMFQVGINIRVTVIWDKTKKKTEEWITKLEPVFFDRKHKDKNYFHTLIKEWTKEGI